MSEQYKNSQEHLYDELLLVDLLIHSQVIKFRAETSAEQNQFSGLYISEEEIDELLKESPAYDKWSTNHDEVSDDIEKILLAIKSLSSKIRTKIENSLKAGIQLKLVYLADLYQLNSFEVNLLTICLAPEFNTKYRKFTAYLHNDVTRKNMSVELLSNLTCSSFNERVECRKYFSLQATLFKNSILEFASDRNDPDKPLISKELRVNPRIVDYLLSSDFIDDDLSLIAEPFNSTLMLSELSLPENLTEKLENFISFYKKYHDDNFIFSFYGSESAQNPELASAICNEIGLSLLTIDLHALYHSDLFFERGLDLLLRESKLMPAAIFIKNCDFLFAPDNEENYLKRYFISELDKNSTLTFLSSNEQISIFGEFRKQRLISLEIPLPTYTARKELWNKYLENYPLDESIDLKEMAGLFNLSSEQIKDSALTASTYALWRSPESPEISQNDLREACHIHSNQRMRNLAQRIIPKKGWNDIVLEPEILNELKDIIKMIKYKHIVYDEWGFGDKLSLGKGVSALLYGEPGTGKTLACEIIAKEINMDIYKIDISTIVSKYIGETEKNLNKIFTEAESSNAILFFDEADALIGKRTEVKDSHDRYANLEVSYLLQKIDEYSGIVMMATNYNQNIDDAFERRIHFSIKFPFPNEESRKEILKRVIPAKTPVSNDIDFDFLAKHFDLSGGHLKNIILTAAFYAAENRDKIDMQYILRAGKREFEKIGRLWDTNKINFDFDKNKKVEV